VSLESCFHHVNSTLRAVVRAPAEINGFRLISLLMKPETSALTYQQTDAIVVSRGSVVISSGCLKYIDNCTSSSLRVFHTAKAGIVSCYRKIHSRSQWSRSRDEKNMTLFFFFHDVNGWYPAFLVALIHNLIHMIDICEVDVYIKFFSFFIFGKLEEMTRWRYACPARVRRVSEYPRCKNDKLGKQAIIVMRREELMKPINSASACVRINSVFS